MFCQNCSRFLKPIDLAELNRKFSRTANTTKSHYETLNLPQDCTPKQIRAAFIKLSKEHHPDVNKGSHSHDQILKINEAYNVLSKPQSRLHYDLSLSSTHISDDIYCRTNPYSRSRPQFYHGQYGQQGKKRFPNSVIALGCCLIALFGVGWQFVAIKHSIAARREAMKKRAESLVGDDHHPKNVQELDNEHQLNLLKMRLLVDKNEE